VRIFIYIKGGLLQSKVVAIGRKSGVVRGDGDTYIGREREVPGEADRNIVVLSRLRGFFGSDTVVKALALLEANKTPMQPLTRSLSAADLGPAPPAGTA
jgi:hypothetical protein